MNPFALETYKQEQIDSKIREETKRAPVKKKVKVNADKFAELADSGAQMDDRFSKMFKDEDFVIDPNSERAQLLKPVCKYLQLSHEYSLLPSINEKSETYGR